MYLSIAVFLIFWSVVLVKYNLWLFPLSMHYSSALGGEDNSAGQT